MASMLCPYCRHHMSITPDRLAMTCLTVKLEQKNGPHQVSLNAYVCPNEACKELMLNAQLNCMVKTDGGVGTWKFVSFWPLRPQGNVRTFPEYVPQAVRDDHREAGLIVNLSPKASATLSRRCLQTMIRDFWGVRNKPNLKQEIEAIKDRVEPATWAEIDAVRELGNIGAHMEKNIDLIVDVEPDEAKLLLQLIEDLIQTWYVHRYERQQLTSSIIATAASKKALQSAGKAALPPPSEPGLNLAGADEPAATSIDQDGPIP